MNKSFYQKVFWSLAACFVIIVLALSLLYHPSDKTVLNESKKLKSQELLKIKTNEVESQTSEKEIQKNSLISINIVSIRQHDKTSHTMINTASPLISSDPIFDDQVTQINEEIIKDYEQQSAKTESKLGKTEIAFNEIFNAPVTSSSTKIHDIISKADEEGKAWICEQIVERFHTDPSRKVRQVCLLSITPFPQACRKLVTQALSDENMNVRRTAAMVASWPFFTEKELDALYQAAKEGEHGYGTGTITRNAISAMGLIGGEKASKLLRELLEDDNCPYKGNILVYLGFMNDLESFKVLESVVSGDRDIGYRGCALHGLMNMAVFQAPHLPIRGDGRSFRNPEIYSKTKSILVNQINSDDSNVRLSMAYAFGKFGEMEDISLLEPLLSDDYSKVVSYTEGGEVKEKVVYPIREKAREAIEKINKRFPPEKRAAIADQNSYSENPVIVDANETLEPNMPSGSVTPFRTYTLVAIGVVIAVAGAAIFLKKKAADRRK